MRQNGVWRNVVSEVFDETEVAITADLEQTHVNNVVGERGLRRLIRDGVAKRYLPECVLGELMSESGVVSLSRISMSAMMVGNSTVEAQPPRSGDRKQPPNIGELSYWTRSRHLQQIALYRATPYMPARSREEAASDLPFDAATAIHQNVRVELRLAHGLYLQGLLMYRN